MPAQICLVSPQILRQIPPFRAKIPPFFPRAFCPLAPFRLFPCFIPPGSFYRLFFLLPLPLFVNNIHAARLFIHPPAFVSPRTFAPFLPLPARLRLFFPPRFSGFTLPRVFPALRQIIFSPSSAPAVFLPLPCSARLRRPRRAERIDPFMDSRGARRRLRGWVHSCPSKQGKTRPHPHDRSATTAARQIRTPRLDRRTANPYPAAPLSRARTPHAPARHDRRTANLFPAGHPYPVSERRTPLPPHDRSLRTTNLPHGKTAARKKFCGLPFWQFRSARAVQAAPPCLENRRRFDHSKPTPMRSAFCTSAARVAAKQRQRAPFFADRPNFQFEAFISFFVRSCSTGPARSGNWRARCLRARG